MGEEEAENEGWLKSFWGLNQIHWTGKAMTEFTLSPLRMNQDRFFDWKTSPQKAPHNLRSITLTSIFRSKEVKIPLLVPVLPGFTVDAGIRKHWLEKAQKVSIHYMK